MSRLQGLRRGHPACRATHHPWHSPITVSRRPGTARRAMSGRGRSADHNCQAVTPICASARRLARFVFGSCFVMSQPLVNRKAAQRSRKRVYNEKGNPPTRTHCLGIDPLHSDLSRKKELRRLTVTALTRTASTPVTTTSTSAISQAQLSHIYPSLLWGLSPRLLLLLLPPFLPPV